MVDCWKAAIPTSTRKLREMPVSRYVFTIANASRGTRKVAIDVGGDGDLDRGANKDRGLVMLRVFCFSGSEYRSLRSGSRKYVLVRTSSASRLE